MTSLRLLLLLLLTLLLLACAPKRSVHVQPLPSARPTALAADEYVVVRGDTLYGIAFRNGLDYRDLAALNSISSPYTIYPGQRLRIGKVTTPANAAPAPVASASRPAAPSGPAVVAPIVRNERAEPSATPATSSGSPAGSPAAAVTASEASPAPATSPGSSGPLAALPSGPPRWQWPAEGPLVQTFLNGDPTRQGINIAGSGGDPVKAAAAGVVVYSGSGLIGYGELIIVKHDDTWLSAYGHNRKRLVAEGAVVSAGQLIAEMGRSGASRDMLHFEIRKSGRSVDPISVLPRR